MRVYYIFLIKKEIFEITKNDPYSLYKLLESIYYLDKKDISIGVNSFERICNIIPKKNINKMVRDETITNLSYMLYNYTHLINDFLSNETSKLEILNTHMKLKTNAPLPTFFKSLKRIPYLFIVDFNNMDYFYLQSINTRNFSR